MSRAGSAVLVALVLLGLAAYFIVVPPKGFEENWAHRIAMPVVLVACALLIFDNLRIRLHVAQLIGALRSLMGQSGAKVSPQVRAEAIGILIEALRSDRASARAAAAAQLRQMTGQQFGEDAAAWEEWWRRNRTPSPPGAS